MLGIRCSRKPLRVRGTQAVSYSVVQKGVMDEIAESELRRSTCNFGQEMDIAMCSAELATNRVVAKAGHANVKCSGMNAKFTELIQLCI